MAKITGLGGIFHIVKDPEATRAWYRDKLGLDGEYGPLLKWSEEAGESPYSLISHFTDGEYLKPSNERFMINLRVDDLQGFIALLKSRDVEVLDHVDEGYGEFAWIMDLDGVKIELWQQKAVPED
ncbi:VOC family protein [Alterisphingorhabdus coralli]|uniref:VOC family protein n=1 Tax=Alterisphingorhabdus coralli TaxID=3071408 RepID=A0AA97F8Z1_9SPHN|nr:VOC family protein [Parasphingorhabdus sp. SCSIO 66989]WOE75472.1 VOC family protein [Parasphingorhabdus sp. SCSIO 66989]